MFLKRLEVIGFKSFADHITIEFDKGVTAVVGPNGSGKSNISDGIRWVLGEQSAKSLRGSKMEDIIFAGSDTRKPLNFAEVTLVLDNSDQYLAIDYLEVSVTRRIYRSGESEYLLNKQPCRLKDIIDLFLDSGLGKEAYSIIGQGKVEEILSSKSEERRVIFEEAAGVLKYKTRKIKAEKKLAETEGNLNRVEDIILELEGQIEPLKMQSEIAKDYLEKKAALKEIEVALIVHEITEIHKMWEEQKEKLALMQRQEEQLKNEWECSKENIEQFKKTLKSLDEQLANLQNELLVASETLEKSEGQRKVFKERKKNVIQNKEQIEKLLAELNEKKLFFEQAIETEQQKLIELEDNVQEKKKQHAEMVERLQLLNENLAHQLEQLKSDYIEILNEQASKRNELRFVSDQLEQLKQRKEKLIDHNQHLLSARNDLLKRKSEMIRQIEEQEIAFNEKLAIVKKVTSELENDVNTFQKLQGKLYNAYQLIQQVRSRKEVLEEMQADFSGYFQGVREVLKERGKQLIGIIGAIAELIQVPKQYETAIDIALGGASQYIVAETEVHAREAIQFLKKHRYGRATFLPLTVIKGKSLRKDQLDRIESHQAFVGIAAHLIQYDERYQSIITNLLGNVIVAKDLLGANEIARLLGYSQRIVTLEGDVINPGGAMTGGAVKQNKSPILSRQREIEELTEKLQELEQKTLELENNVKLLKENIAEKEQKNKNFQTILEKEKAELQNSQSLLIEMEHEEKLLNERLREFDRDETMYQREIDELEQRIHQLTDQEKELVNTAKNVENEIYHIEQRIKEQQISKQSIQNELTELKIEIAKDEERFVNQREKVNRLLTEKRELIAQLNDLNDQYQFLTNEMSDNQINEKTIEEMIGKNRKKKEETIQQISTARKERTKIEEQLQIEENKQREKEYRLNYLVNELHQNEVIVNRLDVKLDKMLEQLQSDYELSFEAAKQSYPLQMDVEEAKAKVRMLKTAIEKLGIVNLGAIEEYERIHERYSFLIEQQKDLIEAKETLHQIIAEMDQEMVRRFKESFEQIRHHFQIVYKKLFGGGFADLVLTEPDQLLTTGVEIVASPPGKKLQNLALLSGGERALTAIALLFAILNVRPVPFCVLDEVEAALDEANVHRFASYLKEFSDKTQFIVITHRKGTMEEADVLYGVTMQESGVSKLVSVRLEDSKQYIES